VSLLSSDSLRVFVAADRVAVVRTSGRFGSARRAQPLRTLHVEAGDDSGKAMLAALGGVFEEARAKRVSVVLSNALVRYLVVPWSDRITSAEERNALARHAFTQVFGAAAAGWTFVVSPAGKETHTLAAAVDTSVLEGLRGAAGRSGARLRSVQPLLMAVYNHWRADVGREALSLLLLEPGRWCWASLAGGVWQRVQSGRVDARDDAAVAEIMTRQSSLDAAGAAPALAVPQVWVYAEAGVPSAARLAAGGWRLRDLVLGGRDRVEGMEPGAEHALLAA